MTLLDKANKVKRGEWKRRKENWSDEHLDIAIACIEGKITHKQMMTSMQLPRGYGSSFFSSLLPWAIREGKLIRI